MVSLELEPEDRQIVLDILRTHLPEFDIWVFGSRVTGTARRYSDLDLVVLTNVPLDDQRFMALLDAFRESDLPFRVDIIDWASTSDSFKCVIQQNYVLVQKGTS